MDVGGLRPSYAPPVQQTADSSNVAGELSFDTFAFFPTNAGMPTTAPGIGTDRIAFATAAGATTTVTSAARTAWHFRRGVAHIVQYLPPLLEEVHTPVSINILRTVFLDNVEHLALLVYLTWLLHIGLGFKTCLVPQFFGRVNYVRH
jgi:hypothetical protein